jgi:hypothetical protein
MAQISLQNNSLPLPKPYKKGDWLIFPNVFPTHAKKDLNCEGNIDGICTHADNIDNCIKQCENSPYCHYGYFISKPVKMCLPRMGAYFYPHLNPTLNWESKNENNPMFKDIDMTAFIDPSQTYFPDPYNNSVYFNDQIYLKNIETNTRLFTPSKLISSSTKQIPFIHFSDIEASVLTVSFFNPYNKDVTNFRDLPFYAAFVLSLGSTNFIFRNFEEYIGWILRGNIEIFPQNLLTAIPVNKNEKHFHVSYGTPFYIKYGNQGYLGLDSEKRLKIYNDTLENLKNMGNRITFTFESLMSVYTCQEKKCIEIPQKELEPGKATSNYKGQSAFRSPNCFGVCEYDLENLPKWTSSVQNALLYGNDIKKHKIIYIILFILIIIYIVLLLFFKAR